MKLIAINQPAPISANRHRTMGKSCPNSHNPTAVHILSGAMALNIRRPWDAHVALVQRSSETNSTTIQIAVKVRPSRIGQQTSPPTLFQTPNVYVGVER